jgi:hypothetical protein
MSPIIDTIGYSATGIPVHGVGQQAILQSVWAIYRKNLLSSNTNCFYLKFNLYDECLKQVFTLTTTSIVSKKKLQRHKQKRRWRGSNLIGTRQFGMWKTNFSLTSVTVWGSLCTRLIQALNVIGSFFFISFLLKLHFSSNVVRNILSESENMRKIEQTQPSLEANSTLKSINQKSLWIIFIRDDMDCLHRALEDVIEQGKVIRRITLDHWKG